MSVPAPANATRVPMEGPVTYGVIAPSLQRTAAMLGAAMDNHGARGVTVIIKTTAHTDTPAMTAVIQGYDAAGDSWFDILTSVATLGNAEAVTRLTVYPGLTPAANVTASDVLPGCWRVKVTPTDADPCTYSVGYSYLA